MHRAQRFAAAFLAATIVFSAAITTAFAADKPLPWQAIDVVVHNEDGNNLLIVSGELPEKTKLPAAVELAVPAGSEIQWAGEILGGDVSADPDVEYTVTTRDGNDVYSFTLTKSRVGQIEVSRADLIVTEGGVNRANLAYTPATDVGELRLKYRLPQAARVAETAEGASMVPGPTGFSYYERVVANAEAGKPQSLAFTFSGSAAAPAEAGGQQGTGGTSSGTSPVLFIVLGVSAVALAMIGMGMWKKMQAKGEAAVQPSPAPKKGAATRIPPRSAAAAARTNATTRAKQVDADGDPEPQVAAAPRSGKKLATGAVVVLLVAGSLIAISVSKRGVQVGDTVQMQYAQVDTCTTSNISLTPTNGGDIKSDQGKVLESLRTVTGVGNATLHLTESRIEVRYCDSSVQEGQVLEALNSTGYSATPLAPAAEEIQKAAPADAE